MPRLVIVSNRVALPDSTGKAAAGGLAVALREAFKDFEGLWFGWSGKVAAEPASGPRVTQGDGVQYALMDLTARDRREYYSGFANRALWPTMHYRIGLSEFSRADYDGYLRVNCAFAGALAKLIRPDDLVWVHDYHLIPLAAELRARGIMNPIGYFHHIPWPAPEVLGTLPGSRDLLNAIRSYTLIGVQTQRDTENLSRSLVEELGAVSLGGGVLEVSGENTRVAAFPIGIEAAEFEQVAVGAGSSRIVRQTAVSLGARKLVIGVDRLDYSKGIPERMQAFERFLGDSPEFRGRVTYLQIAPTSRSEVPEYAALSRVVNETLGRVNGALGEPGWVPIHYVSSAYSRAVLAGLYRLAHVGLITPMRDGMNLVAKEYVAAQDPTDPGVLVLSRFAGAAEQLSGAIVVNPNDKLEVAGAILSALEMPVDERIARWQSMIGTIRDQDISWWAGAFLRDLTASMTSKTEHALAASQSDNMSASASTGPSSIATA